MALEIVGSPIQKGDQSYVDIYQRAPIERWVKNLLPPVVHMKIVGIYGCSSP